MAETNEARSSFLSVMSQLLQESGRESILAPYVPLASEVAQSIIEFSGIGSSDVIFDLGCGDGRLLTAAALQVGCQCFGYDIDKSAIEQAKDNIAELQLENLVSVEEADFTKSELSWSQATVIFMYLTRSGMKQISPFLLQKLSSGIKLVVITFPIPEEYVGQGSPSFEIVQQKRFDFIDERGRFEHYNVFIYQTV